MRPGPAPTPLADPGRAPIVIAPIRSHRGRFLRLSLALVGWLLRAGIDRLLGRFHPEANARRVRAQMEDLGFLCIKLGQILSLRTDVFSKEFCRELSSLQHRAHGFDPAISRRVIESELGGPIDRFFSRFEDHPFAAASISQLHRARLREEDVEVVVKVLRPEAARLFQADLAVISRFVRWLDRWERFARFRFSEGLWELTEVAKEEVDYRYELANLRRFRKTARRHGIYVPKGHPAHSTSQVLVMERVDGALMSDVLEVVRSDPERVRAWFAENRIDPGKVGRKLVLSFLRQLLEDDLFHGDLHPGNILLTRENGVTLIDLGSLGAADLDLVHRYYFTLKAIATNEFQKSAEHILAFSAHVPAAGYAEAKEEMVRTLRSWTARTHVEALPYHEKSISRLFVLVVEVMARYGIPTSWGLLRVDRALVTLDASIAALAPDLRYQDLLHKYYGKRLARRRRVARSPRAMERLLLEAPEVVSEYRLFMDGPIRRWSPSFSAEIGKFASLIGFVLDLCSGTLFLAGTFFLLTYLYQHHGILRGSIENDWLEIAQDSASSVPRLEDELWLLAIVVDLWFFLAVRRLKRKFRHKEVVLPGIRTTA